MTKFKTFRPFVSVDPAKAESSAEALNKWLKENPNVEIISWQTTAVGNTGELYITIQYRTREVCTHD